MKYVPSTYKILYYRALESRIDKEWIDWTIEMIVAGFETEHLLYLASFDLPSNQFKLQEVADKALKELGLDYSDRKLTTKNYANYTIQTVISGEIDYFSALYTLKDIYVSLNYPEYLHDFYLLYFAKNDLLEYGDQMYWDGANSTNIDSIIDSTFRNWSSNFDTATLQ